MKSLQGCLLVASPNLRDPNFFRSVILIVQHDENGALGLILNRPTTTTMVEAWKQVSEDPCPVEALLFQGGPCEGPLMVLHDRESLAQIEVGPGICFSTEAQSVSWLVENSATPTKYFVGYAGWGPDQLETEMSETAWFPIRATAQQVFEGGEGGEDQWLELMKALTRTVRYPNLDPKLIPPDPSMN